MWALPTLFILACIRDMRSLAEGGTGIAVAVGDGVSVGVGEAVGGDVWPRLDGVLSATARPTAMTTVKSVFIAFGPPPGPAASTSDIILL
jgi:hypothetical protein